MARTRSSRLRAPAAVSLALAVSLLVACGIGGDPTTEPPPDGDPTAEQEAPSDEPDAEPTPDEPDPDEPTDDPDPGDPRDDPDGDVPADWQEVDLGDGTFMVPPTWEVERYDANGVERERALYGRGHCPTDEKMVTGLAFTGWVPDEVDAAAALAAEADRMASSAFEGRSPQVELSGLQQNGDWVATVAAVRMEPSDDPCVPVEAVFVLRGAPYQDGSGTFVFTVVGELGLDASPGVEDLVAISNSLVT